MSLSKITIDILQFSLPSHRQCCSAEAVANPTASELNETKAEPSQTTMEANADSAMQTPERDQQVGPYSSGICCQMDLSKLLSTSLLSTFNSMLDQIAITCINATISSTTFTVAMTRMTYICLFILFPIKPHLQTFGSTSDEVHQQSFLFCVCKSLSDKDQSLVSMLLVGS